MAITENGIKKYEGLVLSEYSHMWMDGMEEVHCVVYNPETNKLDHVQVGYYGSDGNNLCECSWKVDITKENQRAIVQNIIIPAVKTDYETYVDRTQYKPEIDVECEVIRGRKVAIGTKVTPFWIGEKETYRSRTRPHWANAEYEKVAGCYDEAGNKVWIKEEYLKRVNPKEYTEEDRKEFMRKALSNLYSVYGPLVSYFYKVTRDTEIWNKWYELHL